MANQAIYVQKPPRHEYPDDFELFFRQFKTFVRNIKCEPASQYDLLLGFLDKKAYQLVESILFTETEKTAIEANIDAALPKLKIALTPPNKMPPKIELKFRKQGQNESLNDFGFAIQHLGTSAFGPEAQTNGQVIDAFCIGIRSPGLSAKLLEAEFNTLSEAIAFATNKESAQTIKKFVVDNRTGELVGVSVLQMDEAVNNVAELTDQAQTQRPQQMQNTYPSQRPQQIQNISQRRQQMQNTYPSQRPQQIQNISQRRQQMQNTYPSQRPQQMQNTYRYPSQRAPHNHYQQQSSVTPQRYEFSTLNNRGGAHRGEHHQQSTRTAVNNNHVQCYSCKGYGHYSNSCPRKNSSKTCYYCGKPGHLQRICLKRQNDEQFDQWGNSRNTRGSRDFRRGPGTRQM